MSCLRIYPAFPLAFPALSLSSHVALLSIAWCDSIAWYIYSTVHPRRTGLQCRTNAERAVRDTRSRYSNTLTRKHRFHPTLTVNLPDPTFAAMRGMLLLGMGSSRVEEIRMKDLPFSPERMYDVPYNQGKLHQPPHVDLHLRKTHINSSLSRSSLFSTQVSIMSHSNTCPNPLRELGSTGVQFPAIG